MHSRVREGWQLDCNDMSEMSSFNLGEFDLAIPVTPFLHSIGNSLSGRQCLAALRCCPLWQPAQQAGWAFSGNREAESTLLSVWQAESTHHNGHNAKRPRQQLFGYRQKWQEVLHVNCRATSVDKGPALDRAWLLGLMLLVGQQHSRSPTKKKLTE